MLPYQEVLLWGIGLSLLTSILYRILTKPEKIRKIKEDMKYYRERVNKATKDGDTKKQQEFTSEMMKQSQKQLMASMKPMFASLIVFALVLSHLGGLYGENGLNIIINLPFWVPFIGTTLNWFGWYILCTMPFTWLFRKYLGVE